AIMWHIFLEILKTSRASHCFRFQMICCHWSRNLIRWQEAVNDSINTPIPSFSCEYNYNKNNKDLW
ncbi:MAG TPA: hypothetical protein VNB68_03705, partial [Nitrososphaeraceae archaeon]|nr:hypothetical protein [Nitrososphaeraceae archaeon]